MRSHPYECERIEFKEPSREPAPDARANMRSTVNTLFMFLSLVAGSLLAVQAGANAQLSKALGSPMAATTLQLGVGALLLLSVTVLTGTLSALPLLGGAPAWHIFGGMASAFYVVSTILLFPRIGAVMSVGLFIAGQVLASAALDVFGLLGVAASGLTPGIAAGAILVMAGAGLIVLGQEGGRAAIGRTGLGWIALALLAGAVLPVQGAINALLRQDLGGAAFAVGLVSFAVAMLTMTAVQLGVSAATAQPRPHFDGVSSMPWWGWLGGVAGAT
jgi:transporter family-2 protein